MSETRRKILTLGERGPIVRGTGRRSGQGGSGDQPRRAGGVSGDDPVQPGVSQRIAGRISRCDGSTEIGNGGRPRCPGSPLRMTTGSRVSVRRLRCAQGCEKPCGTRRIKAWVELHYLSSIQDAAKCAGLRGVRLMSLDDPDSMDSPEKLNDPLANDGLSESVPTVAPHNPAGVQRHPPGI